MFKFSIRDVLLLTLVVALVVGWWAHHRAMSVEHRRLEVENEYLREQLLELQFPQVKRLDLPEEIEIQQQTLEWIPPVGN